MNIILDNIAIWQPMVGDGKLNVRQTPAGVVIQKAGTNVLVKSEATIYRYAKNYKTKGRGGVSFCLFVRTYLDDAKKVEQALDEYAASLQTGDVTAAIAGANITHFVYSNKFLEVK